MKFEYTGIISSSPDTGDHIVIFRPEIRIAVHGPTGSSDFLALVDTGTTTRYCPNRSPVL